MWKLTFPHKKPGDLVREVVQAAALYREKLVLACSAPALVQALNQQVQAGAVEQKEIAVLMGGNTSIWKVPLTGFEPVSWP
jgi:fructose-1-phosphate kinase PfkB-like protein